MLGSPILYLKGMRVLMFQLSGFYYKPKDVELKASGLGLQVWELMAVGCIWLQDFACRFMVEARKLEHGFRRIRARIPYSLR